MWSETFLVKKSRKAHRCSWCDVPIVKGSLYFRVVGHHGDFWSAKMHPECKHAWATTCDDEWTPGEFDRGGGYNGEVFTDFCAIG